MKSAFVDFVMRDLLNGVPDIRARAMFGGHGIYKNDTMFAIIVDDELYFKVGDANRSDFESRCSKPYCYAVKGKKPVTMSYWNLPAEIMDNRQDLIKWLEKAAKVSLVVKYSKK